MRIFLSLLSFLLVGACSSETHESTEPSERPGILFDTDGNRLGGSVVRLITVDDQGVETTELATTVSDTNGQFLFDLEGDTNASVLVVADLSDKTYRGYWAGSNSQIPIHPLTEGLVSVILAITETEGGRAVTDFTASELRSLTTDLFTLDSSSLDLSDVSAIESFVRDQMGRQIALASGGAISAISTTAFEGTEDMGSATFENLPTICDNDIYLFASNAFRFDIRKNGTICGGVHETLPGPFFGDTTARLYLPPTESFFAAGGSVFPATTLGTAPLEGEREISLGPYDLKKPLSDPPEVDPLSIARKVYVPASGDFVRFLDIFTNSDSTARSISFTIETLLSIEVSSIGIVSESSESSSSPSDRFLVAYDEDGERPSSGFIFQGLGSLVSPTTLNVPGLSGGEVDEVSYAWADYEVPANSTRAFLHYLSLSTTKDPSELRLAMRRMADQPDMTGLSLEEMNGLVNFSPAGGTVVGEAGSVIGQAAVTAVELDEGGNETTNTKSVTAQNDGSFAVPLDLESGDQVQITASDGLDTLVTVP